MKPNGCLSFKNIHYLCMRILCIGSQANPVIALKCLSVGLFVCLSVYAIATNPIQLLLKKIMFFFLFFLVIYCVFSHIFTRPGP